MTISVDNPHFLGAIIFVLGVIGIIIWLKRKNTRERLGQRRWLFAGLFLIPLLIIGLFGNGNYSEDERSVALGAVSPEFKSLSRH